MKVFKKFNCSRGLKCFVCRLGTEKEAVLVTIQGTENGAVSEARQYHLDCINLVEQTINGRIYLTQLVTP